MHDSPITRAEPARRARAPSTGAFAEADAIASPRLIGQAKGDDVDPHEIGSKWVFDDMWGFTADVSQPVLLEFFNPSSAARAGFGHVASAKT